MLAPVENRVYSSYPLLSARIHTQRAHINQKSKSRVVDRPLSGATNGNRQEIGIELLANG